MAVIVHKENDRDSNLGNRISADLKARAQATGPGSDPDFSDAEYTKDMKKTGRFTWVWFVLILLAAASLVMIALI